MIASRLEVSTDSRTANNRLGATRSAHVGRIRDVHDTEMQPSSVTEMEGCGEPPTLELISPFLTPSVLQNRMKTTTEIYECLVPHPTTRISPAPTRNTWFISYLQYLLYLSLGNSPCSALRHDFHIWVRHIRYVLMRRPLIRRPRPSS